jgi:tetratricopeptide (TPR) repeat protein
MRAFLTLCAAVSLVSPSMTARAEGPAASTTLVPTLHRDPKGLKGLNPFWEAVRKGDDAVIAKDLDGARAAYADAIKAEPDNPMGYYRAGEAAAAKGDLKAAEAAYQDALRLSTEKPAFRAKVLFVLADIRERRRSFDEATAAWSNYEVFAKANRGPGVFPAVATERKKRLDDWTTLAAHYVGVKERIKSRLDEAEQKAAESARSPENR